MSFALKDSAYIINGQIFFAQRNHLFTHCIFLGSLMRAFCRWEKEVSIWILSELMDQHPKAPLGVSEPFGCLLTAKAFDEVGPQGLVLSMSRIRGLEESLGQFC